MPQIIELQPIITSSKLDSPHPTRSRRSQDSSRITLAHENDLSNPSIATVDNPSTYLPTDSKQISTLNLALIIIQPSLVNFLASFTNGVITVGLPTIAKSIDLPRELYLWPSSVYGLTSGAMLLIAGSVADIVGVRVVELVGVFLLGVFNLACGLSATGVQLVVFRALQGVALAMHLPASVGLVAGAVPAGRARYVESRA